MQVITVHPQHTVHPQQNHLALDLTDRETLRVSTECALQEPGAVATLCLAIYIV